jgi:hypothetical protein
MSKIDENCFGCQGTKVIELVCLVGAGRQEPSIFGVAVVEPSRSMEREKLFEGPLRFASGNRCSRFFLAQRGLYTRSWSVPVFAQNSVFPKCSSLGQIARTRRVPGLCAFSVFSLISGT